MHEVRIDPKESLLEIRIRSVSRPRDASELLLSVEAGAGLLDFAPFGALLVVERPNPSSRELIEQVTEMLPRLGTQRVAVVGTKIGESPQDPSVSFEIRDFVSESTAREWLGTLRRARPRQNERQDAGAL